MRISDWSSDVCSSDLVASLAHAFADAALRDIASRELLALAIDDRCCPRQKAARIRGETAADPPNEAGKEGLHREATLATDHAAPHTRLAAERSEEHTSELQSLMRISYAVFCLKKKTSTIDISSDKFHLGNTKPHTRNIQQSYIRLD